MTDNENDNPFQVVVKPAVIPAESDPLPEPDADDISLSLDEIEAAYLRALENADFLEPSEGGEFETENSETDTPVEPLETLEAPVLPGADETPAGEVDSPAPASLPASSRDYLETGDDGPPPISEEQVLEALLFVGGEPLSTKKLLEVLGGSHSLEHLDSLLLSLNTHYLAEGRPYEIRLQTGGYVLQLREEFEAVRNRVYGHGPRDVKLAQDALEVLALIAYRQPATQPELEEMGRPNLGPILRQLLRRQLISLERSPEEETPRYRTTPRFLGLFGLQSLDDLPQAGDFQYK